MADLPNGSPESSLDRARCARVITQALQLPGGGELVTGSLRGIPGAAVVRRRFRPTSIDVQLADWRYQPEPSGGLVVAHVVDGGVVAENVMRPREAGAHVAMALSRHLDRLGPRILPDILAMLEGLEIAAD